MKRSFAKFMGLSFLFALPILADDDNIRILIKHENGHTEHSYVADYMSNYLDLLPQVDGDTIEILGRWDYIEAHHSEQYSANMKTVKVLFDLLREHFKADLFHANENTLEFHVEHEGSWYIVERLEYSVPVPSGCLRIRRPNKVSLSGQLVVTTDSQGIVRPCFSARLLVKAESDTVRVIIIPFNAKEKVFLPFAYGLVNVWVDLNHWRLDFQKMYLSKDQFCSVSQRAVVSEENGFLYREVTRF